MRYAHEQPEEARLVGQRGKATVEKLLSLEVIGGLMKQRVEALGALRAITGGV